MKCHYLGWIRSFLDTGFLVHSYSESGTLYPDSSFVKVRFSLCRLYFLCRQGAIGGEKRECFVLHRIIGQTDHKSKYNVAIIIKSSSIEYILFKFKIQESLIQEGHLNYLDVLVGLWQETKPKCVKELKSPKHTEQYKLMYHRIWVVEVKVPIVEWPLAGNLETQKHTGYRNWMCLHVKHRNLNCILKRKETAETGRSPYFPESRR